MLSIIVPSLGELTVLLDPVAYSNGLFHLFCANINATIHCSKIHWQDDFTYEYGWIHIVSYTLNGETITCDHCTAIG